MMKAGPKVRPEQFEFYHNIALEVQSGNKSSYKKLNETEKKEFKAFIETMKLAGEANTLEAQIAQGKQTIASLEAQRATLEARDKELVTSAAKSFAPSMAAVRSKSLAT